MIDAPMLRVNKSTPDPDVPTILKLVVALGNPVVPIVNVVVPDPVRVVGLNVAVAPLGRLVALNVTTSVKLFVGFSVTV